jgi:hypothetical protein
MHYGFSIQQQQQQQQKEEEGRDDNNNDDDDDAEEDDEIDNDDWTRHVDKETGAVYYYNHSTGESSWGDPLPE